MYGLTFSSGKVSFRSVSRNLWIIAMMRSEESDASKSFNVLMLSIGYLYGEANALTGFGELVFQLGAVRDKDRLPF